MRGSSWYTVQNYVLGLTKFYKEKDITLTSDYWLDFSNRDNPKI